MTELDRVMRGPMEDTRAIALLLHAKLESQALSNIYIWPSTAPRG